jgi:hypothetical protein
MKVKCRKAQAKGKLASSGEAQYLLVAAVRTGNENVTKYVEITQ